MWLVDDADEDDDDADEDTVVPCMSLTVSSGVLSTMSDVPTIFCCGQGGMVMILWRTTLRFGRLLALFGVDNAKKRGREDTADAASDLANKTTTENSIDTVVKQCTQTNHSHAQLRWYAVMYCGCVDDDQEPARVV